LPENIATMDDVQEAMNTAQTIIDDKMDKNNPSGSGTFNLNSNNLIGDYSVNLAYQGIASSMYETTTGAYNKAKYGYKTGAQDWVRWTNSDQIEYAKSFSQDPNTGIFSLINPISGYVRNLVKGMFILRENNTMLEVVKLDSPNTASQRIYYIPYTAEFATGSKGDYIHIVGNGTSDTARSNAHTLDWDGNAWYSGDVYVGSTSGTDKDEGSKKLATEEFVSSKIAEAELDGEEVDLSGYALKSELPSRVSQLQNDSGYITGYTETDPTVPAWAKAASKPTYTAAEVGADSKGTASSVVSAHNTATDAHNDIRLALKDINDRLNAFFDSDDKTLDELSEIVTYITSNKALIDSITTSKVSVSDIINNLTTNVSNKPLSAAQGVVLKELIDTLNSGKLDASALSEAINTALAQAKASGEFDGKDGSAGATGVGIKSITI
jgi:hypothetical protein